MLKLVEGGNQKSYLYQKSYLLYLDTLPIHRCGMMNTLAITPEGKVYPCCSVFGETPHLSLGNIFEKSLRQVHSDALLSTLLVLLERQGLGALLEMGKSIDEKLPVPTRVVNACHLCHELFSNDLSASSILRGVENFEKELFSSG